MNLALTAGFIGAIALVAATAFVFRTTRVSLLIILAATFLQGTMELFAGVPSFLVRVGVEMVILLLLLKAIYFSSLTGRKLRAVGIKPVALLALMTLVSMAVNYPRGYYEPLGAAMFVRHIFLYYLAFVALSNLPLGAVTRRTVTYVLAALFLLQLPAGAEKLLRVGGSQEGHGIGTISVQGGSLSATMPLFVIAFLFSAYLWRRRQSYLVLIMLFVLFGIAGDKRALVFFVPLLLFFVLFLYARHTELSEEMLERARAGLKMGRTLIIVVLVSVLGIYTAGRLMRSLSPAGVGGRFDLNHIITRVIEYETLVLQTGETWGRLPSTIRAFEVLYDDGLPALLFTGLGPGRLVESSLVNQRMTEEFAELGIRAGRTGFMWVLLQVGLVGALCILALYWQLLRAAIITYRATDNPADKAFALGVAGSVFVFALDYVVYSPSTILAGAIPLAFYYCAAVSLGSSTRDHLFSDQNGTPAEPA